MAYIKVIDEDEAEGPLFDIYDKIQRSRGRVSNVLRLQSLHPKALQAHLDMYMEVVFGKAALSRQQREMIAVVVSAANCCEYCYTHHGEALLKYVKDEAIVRGLVDDYTSVKLSKEDMALCVYADRLTRTPAVGNEDAVKALRAAGFEDDAILHATEVTAYFNFVNRMVLGLGVDLEDDAERDFDY